MDKKVAKSRLDGAKLRLLRENLGLSMEELAIETEKLADRDGGAAISAKTIWRIENGAGAHPRTIARLAAALSVEPEDLLRDGASKASLAESIQRFDDLIGDRTRDFVGRRFVFDAMDRFISENECGYFLIRGDPGIGKSSIAAQLVKEREYIHHFNVRAKGINKASDFLRSVCAQLIIDYQLNYASLPVEALANGGFLSRLFDEVSTKLGAKEKVVIVVDALDEAEPTVAGANVLYLPTLLPRGIFIVATTRKGSVDLRRECCHGQFNIEHDSAMNTEDIRRYIKMQSDSEGIRSYVRMQRLNMRSFVEHLVQKSEGNFMYLRHVLPEIEAGAYKERSVDEIPVGLENYYEDHWKRMDMRTRPVPRDKINVVYILCEIRQPASRSLILEFAREGNLTLDEVAVQGVLDEWLQFLHVESVDKEPAYSIYHTSFRDFLYRKDIVKAAGVTIKGINKMIADVLWRELFPDKKRRRTQQRAAPPQAASRSAKSSKRPPRRGRT
jgi:transcriptional regulator with XRE-family HTH domain